MREKREREREKKGGGVLQGKGLFPSSVWDPWWNRAAQGAGLLKNRSKVKKLAPIAPKVKVKASVYTPKTPKIRVELGKERG